MNKLNVNRKQIHEEKLNKVFLECQEQKSKRGKGIYFKDALPPGYESLEPVYGYPIINLKTHVLWECTKCQKQRYMSINNMKATPNPTLLCSCKQAERMIADIGKISNEMTFDDFSMNKKSKYYSDPRNRSNALIFHVHCTKHPKDSFELSHGAVSHWIKKRKIVISNYCKTCKKELMYTQFIEQAKTIQECCEYWPNAKITYVGKKSRSGKYKDHLYKVVIPGIPSEIDSRGLIMTIEDIKNPLITGRVRGALECEISEKKLSKILAQDKADRLLIFQTEEEVKNFGAELIKVLSVPNSQLRFSVRIVVSRAQSNFRTIQRGRETRWGKNNIWIGQSMCFTALKYMFPKSEWIWEDRYELDGLEIDALSYDVHGEKLGMEYQGDKSHYENKEVMERDRTKIEIFSGILLVIDKINKITLPKAYDAIKYDLKIKAPHLLNIATPYNKKILKDLYRDSIKELSWRHGEDLEKKLKMGNSKHKLITPKPEIHPGGEFSYICGYCDEHNDNCNVSAYKDGKYTTNGCPKCKDKRNQKTAAKKRIEKYKKGLGELYNQLAKNIKETMSNPLHEGIICPMCQSPNYSSLSQEKIIERIKKDKGFLCRRCFNTGTIASEVYPNCPLEKTVKYIIRTSSLGIESEWESYIIEDFSDEEDFDLRTGLKLPCPSGHKITYSIRRWKHILQSPNRNREGNFCDLCTGIGSEYRKGTIELEKKMHVIHPNATIIEKLEDKKHKWTCGETTHIGIFLVDHPTFIARDDKITIKNNSEFCFCPVCADDKGFTQPSIPKSLGMVQALWKKRAAIIATHFGHHSIDAAEVSLNGNKNPEEIIKDTRYTEITFKCHNLDHPAITRSFSNMFNKSKKGYCSLCLEDANIKHFTDINVV